MTDSNAIFVGSCIAFRAGNKNKNWPVTGIVERVLENGTRLAVRVTKSNNNIVKAWNEFWGSNTKVVHIPAKNAILLRSAATDDTTHEVKFKRQSNQPRKCEAVDSNRNFPNYQEILIRGFNRNELAVWFACEGGPVAGTLRWTGVVSPSEDLKACMDFPEDENLPQYVSRQEESLTNLCKHMKCTGIGLILPLEEIMAMADHDALDRLEHCPLEDDGVEQSGVSFMECSDDAKVVSETETEGMFGCLELRIGSLVTRNGVLGTVKWIGRFDDEESAYIQFESGMELFDPPNPIVATETKKIVVTLEHLSKYPEKYVVLCEGTTPTRTSQLLIKPETLLEFPLPEEISGSAIAEPISLELIMGHSGDTAGIQGSSNSCYLDATLFAMFATTDAFDDTFLIRKSEQVESTEQLKEEVRQILKHRIVNPLRRNLYVPAENVWLLRKSISTLIPKVQGSFMDVEEFMYAIFESVFHLSEFISFEDGTTDLIHGITVEPEQFPQNPIKISHLLQQSFSMFELRLARRPSPGLIIQLPFSDGQRLACMKYIAPDLTLDVSQYSDEINPNNTKPLSLSAIICLSCCHFTTFVRVGPGLLSQWIYMDSSPTNGKPEITRIPVFAEVLQAVADSGFPFDFKRTFPELQIELFAKVFREAYVCIYI